MATFRITINTDNAAFEDDPAAEVARILHHEADRIEAFRPSFEHATEGDGVLDINGNTVGTLEILVDG